MNKIIDNVSELMELNKEELDWILLENKYNKANLRELVRRSLSLAKEYKQAFEYEEQLNQNEFTLDEEATERLEEAIRDSIERRQDHPPKVNPLVGERKLSIK